MQVTLLGTSSMVPTKERGHPALFVSYGNQGILMDCGEGTQRQLKLAGIRPTQITKVLISHWHGDHTLGLPGLIQTLGASEYKGKLEIYGPSGTKERFEHMFKAFVFDRKLEFSITEIKEGTIFNGKEFEIQAIKLSHNIETYGYSMIEHDKRRIDLKATNKLGIPQGPLLGNLQDGKTIEFEGKKITPEKTTKIVKGKKFAYVADTQYCDSAVKLAENADLVVCESTYSSDLQEKAKEHQHLTAKEAGKIAKEAKAKKLILTHFSARYKNTKDIEADAKTKFKETTPGRDLMQITL